MRPEYDFSDGVRGKYADRFPGDCLMVQLDPDVAAAFPDSETVNETLRALMSETDRRHARGEPEAGRAHRWNPHPP